MVEFVFAQFVLTLVELLEKLFTLQKSEDDAMIQIVLEIIK